MKKTVKKTMKQLMAAFVLFFLVPMTSQAQTERIIIPVNWKKVREVANNDPQRIKNLVSRLSANEIDTTMTWNERILAFYGQSFLTPQSEFSEGMKLDKLYNEKKYEECVVQARELLKKNPVSLKALSNAAFSINMLVKDSINYHDVDLKEGQNYYNRMFRIFNTIAITGKGSKELPFYVTAVSDEYVFMRYYLEIWQISSQTLEENCDVFELKESSRYYTQPQLYFEITRVLEIENEMFRQ